MPQPELGKKNLNNEIVFSVYFSGTGQRIDTPTGLSGLLYSHTANDEKQLALGFSGTQVTHGLLGLLFGLGIQQQCKQVKKQVLDLIRQGKKVTLNCYGHSRGAVTALYLAKMLGGFDEDVLEINLALMDAVPGNLLHTRHLDFLKATWANQTMDLSKSHNLKRVLSLYTNEPHPYFAAHAPVIPKYPEHTAVEEDAIPGAHSNAQAQRVTDKIVDFINRKSMLTFVRIKQFLQRCGTAFRFLGKKFVNVHEAEVELAQLEAPQHLNAAYEQEKTGLVPNRRLAHSYRSAQIKTFLNRPYVNKHHLEVMRAIVKEPPCEGKYEEEKNIQPDRRLINGETGDYFALNIEPPLAPRFSRSERDYQAEAMAETFKSFLAELINSLTRQSRSSTKGVLLTRLQTEAAKLQVFQDQRSLKNAIRNVLALVLQKDRFSLLSMTKTGGLAKGLLHQERYHILTELIQGSSTHAPRYGDLRMFVLGENKPTYFNSRNRERAYQILQKSSLLADNLSAYRANLPLQ